MQDLQRLTERIAKLHPAQQRIVEELVQKLENASAQSTLILDRLIDEFEHEHPELLRLLAH